jgi:3-oxoacid CoA-transferase subunit B
MIADPFRIVAGSIVRREQQVGCGHYVDLDIGPFPNADEVDPDLINAGKQTISEGKMIKDMGAMDLVAAIKKVIVVLEHPSTGDHPKFIPECTLPVTGKNVVDMVITDLAVFHRKLSDSPFRLIELASEESSEEVAATTTAGWEAN